METTGNLRKAVFGECLYQQHVTITFIIKYFEWIIRSHKTGYNSKFT